MKNRAYVFTSFEDDLKINEEAEGFKYAIYGHETCPTTQRHHLQGYIELSKPMRIGAVQRILGDPICALFRREGTPDQARDYCRKDGNVVEFGTYVRPKKGTRSDLVSAKNAISSGITRSEFDDRFFAIVARYPRWVNRYFAERLRKEARLFRQVTVDVYVGSTGTGKTKKAIEDHPDIYVVPLPSSGTIWWDGYTGQKEILLDELYGQVRFSYLLRLLDGHRMMLQVKGSFTHAAWETVVITSNVQPGQWYQSVPEEKLAALERRISSVTQFPLQTT